MITGRALRTEPRMIVVDDPTAGVDIGSRAQIHRILRDTAAAGAVVILSSTDYEEVATQADRVFVMKSLVGLPGRMPGMVPLFLRSWLAMSTGLYWIAT